MRSVLIVDDDKTNLVSAKKALEDLYKVIAVPAGTDALHFLENNRCDLVLLDVEMSTLDGISTLKLIRAKENGMSVPVAFLTANKRRDTVIEGAKLGIMDYITKPFIHEELRDRVDRLFKQLDEQAIKSAISEDLQIVLRDVKTGRYDNAVQRIEEMLNFLNS